MFGRRGPAADYLNRGIPTMFREPVRNRREKGGPTLGSLTLSMTCPQHGVQFSHGTKTK